MMFADDTTLIASSRRGLTMMIREVRAALQEHGLKLNMDKCKVQTTQSNAKLRDFLIGGERIPMVEASEGFNVLGTQFTLAGRTAKEMKTRIAAAWGKFHQLHPLLLRRDAEVSKRLRLFDMKVTQTLLWAQNPG